jgi:replicative DNA helicase
LDDGSLVRLANVAGKILKAPLYIQSVNKMTIQQVTSLARSLRQKHGIKLAGIDYIQLLAGEGDNREQQISSISKGIKGMAIELGIPVMALSQLTDDGKLRESRSIGQDGDSVWKLKNKGEWQPVFQTVELCVEKCRDGATGQVELLFSKRFTRFDNKSKIDEADTP